MAADSIGFTIREGRARRDVIEDAGIVAGWTTTIKEIQTLTHETSYEQFVLHGDSARVLKAAKVEFTKVLGSENTPDGKTVINYTVETEVPNPVTLVEAGKKALGESFDALDEDNATKALKMRLAVIRKASTGTKVSA